MTPSPSHPEARAEARRLLDRHGERAAGLIEAELSERLAAGDMERVLHLDQVRREIGRLCEGERSRSRSSVRLRPGLRAAWG